MDKYVSSMSYNIIHICIDEIEESQIKGYIYNNTLKEPVFFTDIHNLILIADELFDKNGNPQSSQIKRSFQREENKFKFQVKPSINCDCRVFLDKKGEILTFDIVVKSRSNATWQGLLFYQEEEIAFENVLQLINTISLLLKV